jgi:hypothetical protein
VALPRDFRRALGIEDGEVVRLILIPGTLDQVAHIAIRTLPEKVVDK